LGGLPVGNPLKGTTPYGLIKTYANFAVVYLMRPVGRIIVGDAADKMRIER
jgi:hypothetical protein